MNSQEKEIAWALGIGAAVVAAIMFWPKKAAAATSTLPATASVTLQPGATSVGVARGGTVTLVLPAGASWNTATTTPVMPLPANAVQPTGSNSQSIVFSSTPGNFPITASWVDSTNTAQVTYLNVTVN